MSKKRQKTITRAQCKRLEASCKIGLADINGRRKRYIGFGWIDEGPAQGDEPYKVTGVGGFSPVTGRSASKFEKRSRL